jgi:hypothetical protein
MSQRAGHHRSRHEWRGATGDINSDAFEGIESLASHRALAVFHEPALAEATFGKSTDIRPRGLDRLSGGRFECIECLGDFRWRNGNAAGGEVRAVEFFGVVEESLVTGCLDIFQNLLDRGAHRRVGHIAALQPFEGTLVILIFGAQDLHDCARVT